MLKSKYGDEKGPAYPYAFKTNAQLVEELGGVGKVREMCSSSDPELRETALDAMKMIEADKDARTAEVRQHIPHHHSPAMTSCDPLVHVWTQSPRSAQSLPTWRHLHPLPPPLTHYRHPSTAHASTAP